jgi:hypothetical protein
MAQNTPLMSWPKTLGLFLLNAMIAALPLSMIYLDPSDNIVTPFISGANTIIATSTNLAICALLFYVPIPFCILVARFNPIQKLPQRKTEQQWRNWKWALHKVIVFTLIASLSGVVLLGFTGIFLQPIVMSARGYAMCWQVKVPSTFGAAEQAYAKRGVTCPAKPAVDEWGYWRK